jgi:hypothetical protein
VPLRADRRGVTPAQVATNAAAIRNLAARLERLGYTGDCHAEAEAIARQLTDDGWQRITPPPPVRGPGADADHRRSCKAEIDAALAARRRAEEGAR